MNHITKIYHHFAKDSLYRNSIYLMMSTAIGASFGFGFWVINTKFFSPEQIGLATSLISSVILLTNLSLLGLNQGIIRYLPKSKNKNEQISTVFTIVFFVSFLLGVLYIVNISMFSPKLSFLKENILFSVFFLVAVISLALETIFNSVFISKLSSKYVFYKSIIANSFKIISSILLIGIGTYAIFISATLGNFLLLFVSIYIFYKYFKYNLKFSFNKVIFSGMFKLSLGNYVASFSASLPLNLLPIMITNTLGANSAAYFYMDITIINLLVSIQSAIGQSLFAEGSNGIKMLRANVIKSIKINAIILLPAITIVVLFGKYILLFFGREYSEEGFRLLQILSFSVIFTSINILISSILNVKGKVNIILLMCLIGPLILLTLIYFMIPKGLISLGIAWLIGEGIISIIYFSIVYFKRI